jgi:hypothetical protein
LYEALGSVPPRLGAGRDAGRGARFVVGLAEPFGVALLGGASFASGGSVFSGSADGSALADAAGGSTCSAAAGSGSFSGSAFGSGLAGG